LFFSLTIQGQLQGSFAALRMTGAVKLRWEVSHASRQAMFQYYYRVGCRADHDVCDRAASRSERIADFNAFAHSGSSARHCARSKPG
jgi:hypothetical protein